jgi:hypothetical protein
MEREEARNTQLLAENTRLQEELQALRVKTAREAADMEVTYSSQLRDLTNRRDELETQVQQANIDLAAARADNNDDGVLEPIANPTLADRIEAYDS